MDKNNNRLFVSMSPLRYPGAKRWLLDYIGRTIRCNNLSVDLFVEPFAGGASVAISLLKNGIVKKIGLNERDPLVSAFWYTLFFDTDWLINKTKKADVTLNEWDKIRKSNPRSVRQKAFKCLYLNRTNFSGIMKSNAGPIGGRKQLSKYKIDCRFNKDTIIKRLNNIARFRDNVAFIWNYDWKDAIDAVDDLNKKEALSSSTFYYLDPPFFKKGRSLYTYYFNENDHLKLRNYLKAFSQPWILSYDMCPEIMQIYINNGFSACDVNLTYTTGNFGMRKLGKELIFSNLPHLVSELQLGADKLAGNSINLDDIDITLKNHFSNESIYDSVESG